MATGVYVLEQLLEDAAASRRKAAGVADALLPVAHLAEVWAALDRYAADCLEHNRGLLLPNLCRIGWQAIKVRGRATQRPYFQLLESFCRNFGVEATSARGGPPPMEKDILPVEDFNFSKAAIRFSTELTKDQVSSGLRLIVRQLGEVVAQGRPLSVELTFGKFQSREKDSLQFVFAADLYLAHGLEVPVGAAEDIVYSRPPTFRGPDASTLESIKLQGATVQDSATLNVATGLRKRVSATPATATPRSSRSGGSSRPSSSKGSWEYTRHRGADVLQVSQPGDIGFINARGRSSGSNESGGPRLVTGSTLRRPLHNGNPQEQAHEDALHRQIATLEVRASDAIRDQAERNNLLERIAAEDVQKHSARRAKMAEHSAALQKQIEAKEQRRRAESIAALEVGPASTTPMIGEMDRRRASAEVDTMLNDDKGRAAGVTSGVPLCHSAKPPSMRTQLKREVALATGADGGGATVTDGSANEASRAAAREFRQALDDQILAKQAHQNALKQFERRLEANAIQHGEREEEHIKANEQVARARERELLSAAWNQQNKIKGIREAIEAVERGKRPNKEGASATSPPASALSSRPESWLGLCVDERRDTAGGYHGGGGQATPRSARAPLGAAASLALRSSPFEAA